MTRTVLPELNLTAANLPGPQSTSRIASLDVLRGLAVFGIFWINITIFGLPSGAYSLPSYLGEAVTANLTYWVSSELLVDGVMRGLFSCLFGASAMLYLSEHKLQQLGVARVEAYYRRNMILMLFGIIHAYVLLWPYEVLYAYGLIGLFLFPLRRLSPRVLIVIAVIFLVLSDITVMDFSHRDSSATKPFPDARQELSDNNNPAAEEQRQEYHELSLQDMKEDIERHRQSYLELFRDNLSTAFDQQTIYMYSVHIYDMGGMMLLGMALFQLGILQGKRARRFYFRLMLLGFGIGIASRLPSVLSELAQDFVPSNVDDPEIVNFGITRLPLVLGYVGLVLWVLKQGWLPRLSRVLAQVGRMALTHYVMQTVLAIFIFYGFGLGLMGEFEHYQLAILCLLIYFLQAVMSVLWLRQFRYGPLEWIWRSAMYARWQPMRLHNEN